MEIILCAILFMGIALFNVLKNEKIRKEHNQLYELVKKEFNGKSYDKERFHRLCQKFLNNGLVTPLYETEEYCICNVANTGYMLVAFVTEEYGASGFIVTSDDIKILSKNKRSFIDFVFFLYETDTFLDRMIHLNDRTFDFCVGLKDKTDKEGPSDNVDLELEQKLLGK